MCVKTWLVGSLVFLLSGVSVGMCLANPRDDALTGISRCRAIADDRRFLDCLYGAVQPLRSELGLAAAPAFQTQLIPPAPGVAKIQADQPGNGGVAGMVKGALASSSNLRLASYAFDPRGHFTITLNDGEVWRQADRDQSFADWRGPAANFYVSISSSGDDHYLDVKGDGGPYRIERVR
jgi:hypothetical protein